MKKYRTELLAAAITVGVAILAVHCFFLLPKVFADKSVSTRDNAVVSYDGKYTLSRMDGRYSSYVFGKVSTFYVFTLDDNVGIRIKYDCQRVWGGARLILVTWGVNTNDIWLYSSDEGFSLYKYIGDSWEEVGFSFQKSGNGWSAQYKGNDGVIGEIRDENIPDCIKKEIVYDNKLAEQDKKKSDPIHSSQYENLWDIFEE